MCVALYHLLEMLIGCSSTPTLWIGSYCFSIIDNFSATCFISIRVHLGPFSFTMEEILESEVFIWGLVILTFFKVWTSFILEEFFVTYPGTNSCNPDCIYNSTHSSLKMGCFHGIEVFHQRHCIAQLSIFGHFDGQMSVVLQLYL